MNHWTPLARDVAERPRAPAHVSKSGGAWGLLVVLTANRLYRSKSIIDKCLRHKYKTESSQLLIFLHEHTHRLGPAQHFPHSFRAALCAFALLCVFALKGIGVAQEKPPNILLLVADDQRPDTIAALGNAHI